jgi:hypothetical protein
MKADFGVAQMQLGASKGTGGNRGPRIREQGTANQASLKVWSDALTPSVSRPLGAGASRTRVSSATRLPSPQQGAAALCGPEEPHRRPLVPLVGAAPGGGDRCRSVQTPRPARAEPWNCLSTL